MAPGGGKWDDAAVKDLTFAILLSNGDGNFNVTANWDNVVTTMNSWGHNFTKSAMSQQWTKRILKDFKERHADAHGNGAAPSSTTSATSTPRANKKTSTAGTPKTPRTGNGKKRATPKHEFDDDENNDTPPECSNSSVKREKTPRSNKKVKYEEPDDDEEDNGDDEEEGLGGLPSYPAFQGQEEDDAFEGI